MPDTPVAGCMGRGRAASCRRGAPMGMKHGFCSTTAALASTIGTVKPNRLLNAHTFSCPWARSFSAGRGLASSLRRPTSCG